MILSKTRADEDIKISKLYFVGTKKRLATVLKSNPSVLRRLAKTGDANYQHIFVTSRGKKRAVQNPNPELKEIQVRINQLLQRINYPEYMMAGLKGLSYEKNASAHLGLESTRVCTVDIEKFYPNCQRGAVIRSLEKWFNQKHDVAVQLADLVCLNGHLPTGGPASLLFSFWSNRDVFDEIKLAADAHGLKMTVYVDDMTFSGENAGLKFLHDCVLPVLKRAGLRGHKIKSYHKSCPQEITGIILNKGKLCLPYRRFKDIDKNILALNAARKPVARLKLINSLVSRLYSVSAFFPKCKTKAKAMGKKQKALLSKFPYLKLRHRFGKQAASLKTGR
ncbi:reverse transcriptase family protein [Prosthecobacter fusiformis]|nr:reverse transcriptase family protein [Prosthecobacter fusiformis]